MAVHPNSLKNIGKGRKKGQKNKITKDIKAAYMEAFDKRGGVQGLLDWAEKSPDAFYSQVSKLLPKQVDLGNKDDNPLTLKMTWFPPQPKTIEEWQEQVKRMNAATK